MAGVFDPEIKEILKSAERETDIRKIKQALSAGSVDEANILFKYSVLTSGEYKEIQDNLKRRKDQHHC